MVVNLISILYKHKIQPMRLFLITLVLLTTNCCINGQAIEKIVDRKAARSTFQDLKFGMFIHWGVSSSLGAGEWVMNNRGIRVEDYKQLKESFYPSAFNAATWVSAAKRAGMKYIVFISRHHDGFSNWDTRYSDWKITNTPYGKDVLKQLAAECQKQGMKLGLYYSTLDWSRDDYPYETGRTGKSSGRTLKSDYASYLQFMKNQLTELLTNYGPIVSVWLDGHWDQTNPEGDADRSSRIDWKYEELYSLIHRLQPTCLIGNNHHLTPFPGEDFQMFERDLPGQNKNGLSFQAVSESLPLETCETMNNSWGYNITDHAYKTVPSIIQMLTNAAGLNANLLLNVGPMPSGKIQKQFLDTLAKVGDWMKKFGTTIYKTRGVEVPNQNWGVMTTNGASYYLHVFQPNNEREIVLPNWDKPISTITTFEDRVVVPYTLSAKGLTLKIPSTSISNSIDQIIEIKLSSAKK